MIVSGNLLLAQSGHCSLRQGVVRIDDGHIRSIELDESSKKPDIGGPDALILPGLIDAHLHLPQFDLIGAHGMPLLRWLDECTFPSEEKWQDVAYAQSMTQRVARQLIRHGTTAIAAYATVHHESTIASIRQLQATGLRGVVGQVLMDREAPQNLCRSRPQLIDEAAALQSEFPAGDRLAAAITPRFAISCTEPLLADAGELARQTGAIVQSHLAETRNECDYVGKLFGGRSYVDVYEQTGLLGPRSIFGHGIHLSLDERTKLRRKGAKIAHCPTANSFLRSGVMPRAQLIKDAVSLAVGSDIGAGYERSMVRVARAMIEAAASIGDDFPSAAEAWHAITAGNADALGWFDAGKIEVGIPADLVIAEPDIRWLNGSADPLSMAMFAWDDRWITEVLLRGRRSYPANPR